MPVGALILSGESTVRRMRSKFLGKHTGAGGTLNAELGLTKPQADALHAPYMRAYNSIPPVGEKKHHLFISKVKID